MGYQEEVYQRMIEREALLKRNAELNEIIRPLRSAKSEADYEWRTFAREIERLGSDYGGLDMTPDFQRGHVWTEAQQVAYIENAMRGVISSSGFTVQFNCPNLEMADSDYQGDLPLGFQCVDGLQRITAATRFVNGEIKPFGMDVREFDNSSFSVKRCHFRFKLAIHNFQNRADLLGHYLAFNSGGTPHSEAEIARVRALLESSTGESLIVAVAQ